MPFKLISLLVLAACMLVQAQAAATRRQSSNVAIFIKDSNSGQLRFFGNAFGNKQINQLINNKQDFLEQLRPAGSWGNHATTGTSGTLTNTLTDNNANINTYTNTNTNTNTITATGTGTGTRTMTTTNNNRRRNPNRRRRANRRRRGSNNRKIIFIRQRP